MYEVHCGIYCIRNVINDKCYVGQSINIYKRWKEERNALNKDTDAWNVHLQRAWKKYGEENFEFSILEECDRSLLCDREIFWIEKLNAFTDGYNQTSGGEVGKVLSDETIEKLRKNWTDEKRQLQSDISKEIWSNEERLEKARQLQKKRWEDPIIREKMVGENHHNHGKSLSEEHKNKLRDAHIGVKLSDDYKIKISKGIKQHYIEHPEARIKASERQKQYYLEHPDSLPVMCGADNPNFGKPMSEETKNKMKKSIAMYYNEHPEARIKASEKLKQYNKDHPEFIESKKVLVDQYSKDGKFIKTWTSASDAGRTLGISSAHISACCTGHRKSAGGYSWKHSKVLNLSCVNEIGVVS